MMYLDVSDGQTRSIQSGSQVAATSRHYRPWIAATATALPEHICSREQAWEHFEKLHTDERFRRQARSIFSHSGVDRRYLAQPPAEYAKITDFAQRNRRYQQDAQVLGTKVVKECLRRAGMDPADVTHLLFATTTGLATPSVDSAIALDAGLSSRVRRYPLFGLGCAGGAGAIARAGDLLRGDTDEVVLVLAVEFCGYTFDAEDKTSLAAVAASLFGDGAAALLLVGGGAPNRRPAVVPRVIDTMSCLLPGTRHIMGWEFENNGFRLVLSRELPQLVVREVAGPVGELLKRNGLRMEDVRFPVIHPGGPRVLDAVEKGLDLPPGRLELSRQVLAEIGNLSSATVLFVLDKLLTEKDPQPGDVALVLAPGPGFAIESALIRFEAQDS